MLRVRSRVTVHIAPENIDAGQMIQISAVVTDNLGAPVVAPVLYMQILDSKGRVYWPLAPIVRDANGFSKLISTSELKHNTRYTVRVSTNRKLSPQGYGFFKTSKKIIPAAFIPAMLAPFVLIPQKAKDPLWLIYRTELDGKVCVICKPHEGKRFRPDDPQLIRIGPPELGGETHFNCRCNYDMQLAVNPAFAKIQRQFRSIGMVIAAVQAVKKHKEKVLIQ